MKIKYFLLFGITLFIVLLGYLIFLNSFNLFGESKKEILKIETDDEGLRQAIIYRLSGDATLNPSININVRLGSNLKDNGRTIFVADKSFVKDNDVEVFWKSFDTLKIYYNSKFRAFKQKKILTFKDSTLNVVIIYEQIN